MEHKVFFTELLSLCEADDASLQKLPCYKSIADLVPLRKSALRALAACHYIPECREKIFTVLYHRALNNANNELVEAGHECMKRFIQGAKVDAELVTSITRNMLATLNDFRTLNLNVITRLCHLAELFPAVFNEKLCEQLLQLLKKWLEVAIVTHKQMLQGQNKSGGQQQLKVAAALVRLFQKIPPSHAPQKIIEMLCKLILTTEKNLMVEPGSILREPLMGYLARFPSEAFDYLTTETCARDPQNRRYAEFVLKRPGEEGAVFRRALAAKVDRLLAMIGAAAANPVQVGTAAAQQLSNSDKNEVQFAGELKLSGQNSRLMLHFWCSHLS